MTTVDRRELLRLGGGALAAGVLGPLAGCHGGGAAAVPAPVGAPTGPTPPARTRMPVVFTAHGSPMNAIEDNAFTEFLTGWAARLPRPQAIVCLSAHFEDLSPCITSSAHPETVYDFYGFPDEMYRLRYAAPGSPTLAQEIAGVLQEGGLIPVLDETRGFDHGCWAPLLRLYPAADIPVLQVSLYISEEHRVTRDLGRALAPLRDRGVLILGSGNVTHNLRGATYVDPTSGARVDDWGQRFDTWVRDRLDAWDLDALCDFETASPYGTTAHPTTDHFEPLIACCGAASVAGRPRVTHAFEGFQGRNFSMRCVVLEG